MLHFLPHADFTLVIPGPQAEQSINASIENGIQLNRQYLAALPEAPSGGRLTGSFIYAHPPDYIGRPTLHFNKQDWQVVLRELKEMGLDTVIYQAAVWYEIQECYYPSRLFANFKTWDALTPLCEAVAAENMTLFLGGLGNLMAFDERASEADFGRDRDLQLACFEELLAYRGGFHGFYMSPETAYPGQRQPTREQLLNRYFREVCQGVKALAPGLPVLASPATFYSPGQDEAIFEFLYGLFKDVPIDYMTPQDSIGTFGNRLQYLTPSFAIWQRVCQATGMNLWVNVESFQRARVNTPNDFNPADFTRLRVQLAHAAQVGQKIVSWEVPYFYSSLAGERGVQLRQAYLRSLAAGER